MLDTERQRDSEIEIEIERCRDGHTERQIWRQSEEVQDKEQRIENENENSLRVIQNTYI